MYDVLIIGGGVTGSAIARELSRYDLKTALFEKGEDVCSGTSKANSGIAHAGFDAAPGSWKAKMNIRGSRMLEELSRKLDFPYKRNGSLVLCFDEKDRPHLEKLLEQGLAISDVLDKNDAYHALEKTGGLLITGATGTNVNDLSVLLIW